MNKPSFKRGDTIYYAMGGNQDYDIYTGLVYKWKNDNIVEFVAQSGRILTRHHSFLKHCDKISTDLLAKLTKKLDTLR